MTQDSVKSKSCDDLAVPVSASDHFLGTLDAPVTLVEYGDYECPDCLNAQPVIAELRNRLGDKIRVVFRHFPQRSVHARASAAALAAEAAGAQNRFWEMHDALFRHQHELAELDLTHLAVRIGLEFYRFQGELASEIRSKHIRDDYDGGERSGVKGTPTFFINGCRYRGAKQLEPMWEALVEAMK